MDSIETTGLIVLQDNYHIEYKIAKIVYTEYQNGDFQYDFMPYYNVIDLLGADLFQGIPGIDLDKRKKCYTRKNLVPTFISERTPSKNRENLWELLDEVGMDYLNQLEWLIRTDTHYSGDRLYVRRFEASDEKKKVEYSVSNNACRAKNMSHDLLIHICQGDDILIEGAEINDSNRMAFYSLLFNMYKNESEYRNSRLREGVAEAKKKGLYRGRKKKKISRPKIYEVSRKLKEGLITEDEAIAELGVSRATMYRRFKEL
ncbi:recombinase family protein [Butyrivibrio sp. WCD3002]|jgi:DNA invertase Pin-like site-specific DNA recombinase|uniref:recombinase family protein n=1 Tax=Butyrivibrio sp. WCD3002 TaxID=1280676 RepID=UPI0003FB0374|nr:recombinase family protein [Butyrivibrio sp. WCD3002]